jgi:hypothetical protein
MSALLAEYHLLLLLIKPGIVFAKHPALKLAPAADFTSGHLDSEGNQY